MPQSGSLNNNNIKKLPSTLLTAWRIIPRSPPPPLGCCETTPTGGRCKYYRRHSSRNRLLCWGPSLTSSRSESTSSSIRTTSIQRYQVSRSLFANYLAIIGIMLGHTWVFSSYMYRNIIKLGGLSGRSTSNTISLSYVSTPEPLLWVRYESCVLQWGAIKNANFVARRVNPILLLQPTNVK